MNNRPIRTLAALNLILLVGLALVELSPTPGIAPANAQVGAPTSQATPAKHDYVMISGKVRGRANQDAVYIIEQRSGRMIVIFHDSTTKKTSMIAGSRRVKPKPAQQQKRRER